MGRIVTDVKVVHSNDDCLPAENSNERRKLSKSGNSLASLVYQELILRIALQLSLVMPSYSHLAELQV